MILIMINIFDFVINRIWVLIVYEKTDQLHFDQQFHFLSMPQLLSRHMGLLVLIIIIEVTMIMMIEMMI